MALTQLKVTPDFSSVASLVSLCLTAKGVEKEGGKYTGPCNSIDDKQGLPFG